MTRHAYGSGSQFADIAVSTLVFLLSLFVLCSPFFVMIKIFNYCKREWNERNLRKRREIEMEIEERVQLERHKLVSTIYQEYGEMFKKWKKDEIKFIKAQHQRECANSCLTPTISTFMCLLDQLELKEEFARRCQNYNFNSGQSPFSKDSVFHFRGRETISLNANDASNLLKESARLSFLPANVFIEQLTEEKYFKQLKENNRTIIAVDATPKRGAGLLYYAEGRGCLYYSIDWTDVFNFNGVDSDKFEMINCLIAAETFGDKLYIENHGSDSLLFKVDNTFILDGYLKEKNRKYRDIYDKIPNKICAFANEVTMQHSCKSFDTFIHLCDKLANNRIDYVKTLVYQLELFNKDNHYVMLEADISAKEALTTVAEQIKQLPWSYQFLR